MINPFATASVSILRSSSVIKRQNLAPGVEVLGYVSRIVGSSFVVACSNGGPLGGLGEGPFLAPRWQVKGWG